MCDGHVGKQARAKAVSANRGSGRCGGRRLGRCSVLKGGMLWHTVRAELVSEGMEAGSLALVFLLAHCGCDERANMAVNGERPPTTCRTTVGGLVVGVQT